MDLANLDGAHERLKPRVHIAEPDLRRRERVEHVRHRGIGLQGPLEEIDRGFEVAVVHLDDALVVERLGRLRGFGRCLKL